MKVSINQREDYNFNDFMVDYKIIRKEYLKVNFGIGDSILLFASIIFVILFFVLTVVFNKHMWGLKSLVVSIVMVILLCTYYNIPCVKTRLRKKNKEDKFIKFKKLKKLLNKLGKNYQDKDSFDRFIRFCKERREEIDVKTPIESFGEKRVASDVLIPILVAEITAATTLKADSKGYWVIIAVTVLVIVFAFIFYCLFSPLLHRQRDIYDSLIKDLEELSEGIN